jgi:hypothetical protein
VKLISAFALAGACLNSVAASDPSVFSEDKSAYTLWNPTPRELMRPMSTDRPDLTEGPYTVDAGHFQVELDLAGYIHDRHNPEREDVRVRSWYFGVVNLKAGLLNNLDLQLLVPSHLRVKVEDRRAGTVARSSGFGDMVARMKLNLWGNDGGTTAFGVMPFVKFPTAGDDLGNGDFEGGVIFPFGAELPWGWSLGAMTEVDMARDVTAGGYHPEFINTITFGRDLIGNLGGYVEFFSLVSTERGSDWVGSFNVGFTYAITGDLQLDTGVNIGVTRAADDWNPFLGLSWRF